MMGHPAAPSGPMSAEPPQNPLDGPMPSGPQMSMEELFASLGPPQGGQEGMLMDSGAGYPPAGVDPYAQPAMEPPRPNALAGPMGA